MNPVVLITTDAAATRFEYHWYSAGSRQVPPECTHSLLGAPAKPGHARPALTAEEVEHLRAGTTGEPS